MTEHYEINISKRRCSEDKHGIHWAKVELPDYDEEKAIAKMDMLKLLLGEKFILTLIIKIGKNND